MSCPSQREDRVIESALALSPWIKKKEHCGLRMKNTSGDQQAWVSVHLELFGTNRNPRIPLMATAGVSPLGALWLQLPSGS